MLTLILATLGILTIVGLAVTTLTIYNGIIALQHRVDKAWYNIDVLLKQRHDEIPNLVSVCKEYMRYEDELLQSITIARQGYLNSSTINEKMEWNQRLSKDLQLIISRAENYPNLKANKLYHYVFQRLSRLENEIADARILYNDYVKNFNNRVQAFPDRLIASLIGCQKALYFKIRGNTELIRDVTFNHE